MRCFRVIQLNVIGSIVIVSKVKEIKGKVEVIGKVKVIGKVIGVV